ncbi:Bifunctional sesterterpene synthase astC [Cladobotryum mycophilum]|uniref:Bifunctional sesterterpene synthase astC n=1 Tax=Cladobotryum mycophilum TaxID=491253 RepID=A0ABR0SCJ7_9HYPO
MSARRAAMANAKAIKRKFHHLEQQKISEQLIWPVNRNTRLIPNPRGTLENQPTREPDNVQQSRGQEESISSELNHVPWLATYTQLPDKLALEPFHYISSLPSKGIRKLAIEALDIWYKISQESLDVIHSVIDMLHSSSLMIDDIEDNSTLRRGYPAAHMVFGTSQALNSSTYLFIKCLNEVQKLSPGAVSIFADELRNLYAGQAYDLHRTFLTECPTEEEYISMIDGKTGGLFRMASRLMRSEATQNKDLEVEELLTIMGRFFQIRDDYLNLLSIDYTSQKGSFSDLDEGKFSFMLIHALNTAKDTQLKSLVQMRSRQGNLSPEQKTLVMSHLRGSKSLKYTFKVLCDLQREVEIQLEGIEAVEGVEGNMLIRAIMERLRIG